MIKRILAVTMVWVSVQLARWPLKWALKDHGVESIEEFNALNNSGEEESVCKSDAEMREEIESRNEEIMFPPRCIICQTDKNVGTVANVTTDAEGNWYLAGSVVACHKHVASVWGTVLTVNVGPPDGDEVGDNIRKARLLKAMEIDRLRMERGLMLSPEKDTEH